MFGKRKPLSDDFILYYFYNHLNDTPKYRSIIGLGELFSSSNETSCIYVHYRDLEKCDEEAIRNRVLEHNRDWDENPPTTIEEWESYGEYRFFIPHRSSDWNYEEYRDFNKSFPRNCIENGHPYFRYYKSSLRYLDFKLFLNEKGIKLSKLVGRHELEFISSRQLANRHDLELYEDLIAAYKTACLDDECIVDRDGGVYQYKGENELELLFAPLNASEYFVNQETTSLSRNSFDTCLDSIQRVRFGDKLTHSTYKLSLCRNLKFIIISQHSLKNYCQLLPKKCSLYFYDEQYRKFNTPPIICDDKLLWVPYIDSYVVPEYIKEISSHAFDNSPIEFLDIKAPIPKINNDILRNCKTLKHLIVAEGTLSIWGSSFAACPNLHRVDFPVSLESLYGTFYGCTSLESVHLKKNFYYLGRETFSYCENLTTVIIDGHLRQLDFTAFNYCRKLTRLEFNFGIDEISDSLKGCDNLEYIIFRGKYVSFGHYAMNFIDCPSLKAIYVPREYYEMFVNKTSKKELIQIGD